MQIVFTVGTRERHEVVFRWKKSIGQAVITVDGVQVLRSTPLVLHELTTLGRVASLDGLLDGSLLDIRRIQTWRVDVGTHEHHAVLIVKERPLVLAAFRSHNYVVLVDDTVVEQVSG